LRTLISAPEAVPTAPSDPLPKTSFGGSRPRLSSHGAISLVAITKRYGDERVVDRVSLEIQPGEFFSLLGPSGSGKTTTLMMIAGFADIDEGRILVDGADIASEPPQKRGFGMVFQNYAIFPHLTVFENVAFPLRARRLAGDEVRRRVTDALALVRLERFGDRYARQLSGGQQQRVAIARAVVFQPKVVLMDEPLGALDKNLRFEMQVEIKDIQRRLGMTVVYVTHDQEEAMNMSDRIGIMNGGRVEQVGAPTEMYERPTSKFIGRFLGEANLLEGELRDVAGQDATIVLTGQVAFRATVPKPIAPGTRVSLFVRPERVRLVGSGAAIPNTQTNAATGVIRRRSFLGNVMRYAVEVAGAEMTVDLQNAGSQNFEPGDPVALSWAVRDSLILEA
jgi:spermidine/putrescine ABC transporter ATP-binding subunit